MKLDDLPTELHITIINYLNYRAILTLTSVNKLFRRLTLPYVYQHIFYNKLRYPTSTTVAEDLQALKLLTKFNKFIKKSIFLDNKLKFNIGLYSHIEQFGEHVETSNHFNELTDDDFKTYKRLKSYTINYEIDNEVDNRLPSSLTNLKALTVYTSLNDRFPLFKISSTTLNYLSFSYTNLPFTIFHHISSQLPNLKVLRFGCRRISEPSTNSPLPIFNKLAELYFYFNDEYTPWLIDYLNCSNYWPNLKVWSFQTNFANLFNLKGNWKSLIKLETVRIDIDAPIQLDGLSNLVYLQTQVVSGTEDVAIPTLLDTLKFLKYLNLNGNFRPNNFYTATATDRLKLKVLILQSLGCLSLQFIKFLAELTQCHTIRIDCLQDGNQSKLLEQVEMDDQDLLFGRLREFTTYNKYPKLQKWVKTKAGLLVK